MSQTNAIILRLRQEHADTFESLFRTEVLPLWHEFKDKGKFLSASLTPVHAGNQQRPGVRDYILHVEVPSMSEHEEFDSDPRFLDFLRKVRPALQAEDPLVWLGPTLFQV